MGNFDVKSIAAAEPPRIGISLQGQDAEAVPVHLNDGSIPAEKTPWRFDLVFKYRHSSVRALEAKFLVARDRLKITIGENNVEFLAFKFGANIRPRSELLIRAKIPFTSDDVVEYFSCS